MCENEPNNYARFIQILEIVNVQGKDRYRISRDIHKDEDVVEFGFVEKYYHKFDIQDAKDGDVLDANGAPFIYKKHDKNCVYFCCGVNLAGEFIKADRIATWSSNNKVYPATKEQRDTLMKAMTDAGYEWDAEKLQLKKIEQKPTEYSKEDEVMLNACINVLHAVGHETLSLWLEKNIEKLQPRSAWSEEDEETLENVRKILHANKEIYSKANSLMYNFEELIRKLNKLRGR